VADPLLALEEWCVRENRLDLEVLAQTESIFALSNGHIGLRGNLDEGEPYGLPGSYLNGVYELRPLPYAEAGYGYPESGQALINVTNGKVLRLLVDDEPFDVRYGHLETHERVLDLRAGTLSRFVDWTSSAGQRIRLRSTRLVSLTQRAIAVIRYEVEAVDAPARVVVQSELLANEPMPMPGRDPRVAAALRSPLVSEDHGWRAEAAVELVHRTAQSGLTLAAAMDHEVTGPEDIHVTGESEPDAGRVTITTRLAPGERLLITKYIAYGWSAARSRQALRDQVTAAITAARHSGWESLLDEQRTYLDAFWDRADIDIDGDAELQEATRFNLFHILQSSARAEQRAIPAKGLTGTGYDGHAFWDTEAFVLPVLTYTSPAAARDALAWRHSTLPRARDRARTLALDGAAFPWRTIDGDECSSYWPASTAAFHVNADIADAVIRYVDATEDREFEQGIGLELLAETARLWWSLGHFDHHGRFRIAGVTGPDEYSALADDNVYTNLMAQRNLQAAADAAATHRGRADELGITAEQMASWAHAAASMFVAYDDDLGVHSQALGFTTHEAWDFEATPPEHYPLLLHYPYFDLYRRQVVKQADLVLAMQRCPDAFTPEQKARNFAYYEAMTVRDSSLSAQTQAVIAAEVGQLGLAYDYLSETAFVDFDDHQHNTATGLHLAALAGAWTALVAGFGGFRADAGQVRFAPRLPPELRHLGFSISYRGRCIRVDVFGTEVRYQLFAGEPLEVRHHGKVLVLDERQHTMDIPPLTAGERPRQPAGRQPAPAVPLSGRGPLR
jgi:alpha,alpha-trehalose phosphorylase